MKIEDFVCTAPPSEPLQGISSCIVDHTTNSPIDAYLKSMQQIVGYGTAQRLSEMDKLGGLLLLGIISGTEAYFRSILASCLDVCPVSKSTAAEKSINLGGVLWHGARDFRRSAFEHMSFTSSKDITSASKGYLGFDLKSSDFSHVFANFDAICHLRHGLVHNDGVLPGRNAVQIDVPQRSRGACIRVDFGFLQDAAASTHALVTTFNRTLFREMCARWATSWRARADWDPSDERRRFLQVWHLFISRTELATRSEKSSLTMSKCIQLIKSEFNIDEI